MFTYKFRMNFEDQEGFYREIELRTDQTFLDFHYLISGNLALDPSVESAFFLCDHHFRKKKQIHQHKPQNPENEMEGDQQKKLYMEDCVLSDYIDDPHQRFLYIYDLRREWTFFIELARITKASPGTQYPRITDSVGGIPVEISRKPVIPAGETDEDDLEEEETQGMMGENLDDENLYDDEEMEEMDDSDFYNNSIEIGDDLDEKKS